MLIPIHTLQTVDPKFDELEQRVLSLEGLLRTLVRDIQSWQEEMQVCTSPSIFELEIKCANFGFATAATFVSTEVFGVETVLLAYQVIPSGTFYICAFNLSEINRRMDQKFETCTNGIGMSGFQRDREVPCPTLLPEQIHSMVSP